jgi:hypothetical protein
MRTQLEESAVTSFTDLYFDWGFDWGSLPYIDSDYFDISRFEASQACMGADDAAGALVAISEAAAARGWGKAEAEEGGASGEPSTAEAADGAEAAEEEQEGGSGEEEGAAAEEEEQAAAGEEEVEGAEADPLHCAEEGLELCDTPAGAGCFGIEAGQWAAAAAAAAAALAPAGALPLAPPLSLGAVVLPPPAPLTAAPAPQAIAWPVQAIARGPARRSHAAPGAGGAASPAPAAPAAALSEGRAAGEEAPMADAWEQPMVACA